MLDCGENEMELMGGNINKKYFQKSQEHGNLYKVELVIFLEQGIKLMK